MLMSAEIFRFVTVRPPRQTDTSVSTGVVDLGLAETPLAGSLRDARPVGTRATMTAIAQQFIASPEFINGSAKVDPKLLAFTSALLRLPL
jgi:hypothetical protein